MKVTQRIIIKIVLIYTFIGILWIYASDVLLVKQIKDSYTLTIFQSYKGWFFVGLTAILLYSMLMKYLNEINISKQQGKIHFDLLKHVIEESNDAIYIKSLSGKYLMVNQAGANIIGKPIYEILGKTDKDLFPKEIANSIYQSDRKVIYSLQPIKFEETILNESGISRSFSTTKKVTQDRKGKVSGIVGVSSDITSKEQTLSDLYSTTRSLKMISQCNEELIKCNDETTFLHTVCNILIKVGGFKFVWIGYKILDEKKSVKVIAKEGMGNGYLFNNPISWDENSKFGNGPTGNAIRTKQVNLSKNILEDPNFKPWLDKAKLKGFHSSIALPLIINDESIGALNIYSEIVDFFSDKEVELLKQFSNNLSFGINTIRNRLENEQLLNSKREFSRALHEAFVQTIKSISIAIEKRDEYTYGHQNKVAYLASAIAQKMNLGKEKIYGIYLGGLIHDIGKIAVPAEILAKPSKLQSYEYELIKKHPQIGYEIIKDANFPWPLKEMILQHHERLDGSGYPYGLKDNEILLESKIIAVADTMEAISAHRPYRPSMGIEFALNEIKKFRGIYYDPESVDACVWLFEKENYAFAPNDSLTLEIKKFYDL